jgi:hypothetical protein
MDETALRLEAQPGLGSADTMEKDYAWGDVDQDGDIDLVVVRKQPWNHLAGALVNVLFMNEGGVLVDRTLEYASTSDFPGDQGFLTPTNDRDATLVDVDGDGWLDIVTAVTSANNVAKRLSHPRVYRNLGRSEGAWQGFRHEDARIPQLHPTLGPQFVEVAAGDVTGDGAPDLYFADFQGALDDRLLVNDGQGFFHDATLSVPAQLVTGSSTSCAMGDANGDGHLDIMKSSSNVRVSYNNGSGTFGLPDIIDQGGAAYHADFGDLNGDGLLDVVVVDDLLDRYLLNQGNDRQDMALFQTFTLGGSSGFGGNIITADLNDDGWRDIVIADVDLDVPGCTRELLLHRNLGNPPNVTFADGNDVIPLPLRTGNHDVAVFDVDGDGRLDLVLGRCTGTLVLRSVPCLAACAGDVDNDGAVGVQDLAAVILAWGAEDHAADVDGNGVVAVGDLVVVLLTWGPCL